MEDLSLLLTEAAGSTLKIGRCAYSIGPHGQVLLPYRK